MHVADGEQAPKMAVFNIWRPLRGPVIDAPLAFCDASTLPLDDRVETSEWCRLLGWASWQTPL